MTILLPLDRALRKDEKKAIYLAFHAASYKIYAAALTFAHGGKGAEKLRDWHGALVLARERSSGTHFLSFFRLQVRDDGRTSGQSDLTLVLSKSSALVSGTHRDTDTVRSAIYTDLMTSLRIQFCDNDEAVEMMTKFESVLHVHFEKLRGSRISPSDFDISSRLSSADSSSTVSSWLASLNGLENDDVNSWSRESEMGGTSSHKFMQRADGDSSRSNRDTEHVSYRSNAHATAPHFAVQQLARDMQELTLDTSLISSHDRQLKESPISTKFSPTHEPAARAAKRTSCSRPAHPSRTLSRELQLRGRTVYVRDLSENLRLIESTIVKDGTGGFGDVRKAMFVDEEQTPRRNVIVAIKSVKTYGTAGIVDTKRFRNEAGIWSPLQHKNVLKLLGIAELPGRSMPACLVSPFMKNGHVIRFLKENPGRRRLPLIQGTAEGIAYLHQNSIIHGDLKGSNILVSDTEEPLLCDFGLASLDEGASRTDSMSILRAGSYQWMAKELLMAEIPGLAVSKASDIWAFAMVVIEILTTKLPFPDLTNSAMLVVVFGSGRRKRQVRPKRPDMPECSDALWSLLGRCWQDDPKDRPSSAEVLQELRGANQTTTRISRTPGRMLESNPSSLAKVVEYLELNGVSRSDINENMALVERFICDKEKKGLIPTRSLWQ